MLHKLLCLALAGGLGTLARYGMSGWVQNHCEKIFPWGTVAVNLLGCFLFGVVYVLISQRFPLSGETRTIVLVGFMGAFTTFSTYIFETEKLIQDAEWLAAVGYFAVHNLGGLAAMVIGIILGKWL